MKGLLKKDCYLIAAYGRTLLLVSAVFLFVSAVMPSDQNFFFVIYPVLFAGVLPTTLISYEERSGWNRYCDAMPVSRKTVVSARYLMTLLCFVLLYALTLAVHAAVLLPKGQGKTLAELAGLLPCVGLLAPAAMLPVTLRFGVEKARLVYYVFIGMIVACALIFMKNPTATADVVPGVGILAACAVTLLLFVLSWLLSLKLYEKREL